MKEVSNLPDEKSAASVVFEMTKESVVAVERMATGDQNFVFSVSTNRSEYVIRMTTIDNKEKFISAIYWQDTLIPVGVPLAVFIQSDLEGKYSQFPTLLMRRLPGNDLCNVYSNLTDLDKRHLALEIIRIQATTNALPDGSGYGIVDSYEKLPEDPSWYDFLMNRIKLFIHIIEKKKVFDINEVKKIIPIINGMEDELRTVRARPFLWDASERNVLVHEGKITGIVDVDDICFGDYLFVLALTSVALENEGHDTLYVDYWAEGLQLNKKSQHRLAFYRLFYSIVFMRKHSMETANDKKVTFNVQRLMNIFQDSLLQLEKY